MDDLLAHFAAVRPGRGEENCSCCRATGEHDDRSECDRCDGSGRMHRGDDAALPWCPGRESDQPAPARRRHWREPRTAVRRDPFHGEGPWYHGTPEDLEPGAVIQPGDVVGKQHMGRGSDSTRTWVTNDAWKAASYGTNVYEVDPSVRPKSMYARHHEHYLPDGGTATVLRQVPYQEATELSPEYQRGARAMEKQIRQQRRQQHEAGVEDYGIRHRPMEHGAPVHDLTGESPDADFDSTSYMATDYLTHRQYYTDSPTEGARDDAEAIDQMRRVQGKPDALVDIYRATHRSAPHEMNPGDWVTLSKRYAHKHAWAESGSDDPEAQYAVHRARVPARYVRDAGSGGYREQGYWGPPAGCCGHEKTAVLPMGRPEYGPEPEYDFAPEDWPPEKRDAHNQTMFDKRTQWKAGIKRGLSLGHLTAPEAKAHGYYFGGHETDDRNEPKWAKLPHDLYHVTTDEPSVRRGGLKTRAELSQQRGGHGLGGGEDDTISFTTDRKMAHGILGALHEFHDVVNGRLTPRQMWDQAKAGHGADRPFHQDIARYYKSDWKDGDELPRGLHNAIHEVQRDNTMGSSQEMIDKVRGPGWHPAHDDEGWMSGHKPPQKMHAWWEKEMDPDQRRENAASLYKHFAVHRQVAGGAEDPMFFATDTKAFAAKDPRHFALLHVRPKPGAQGYPVSSMSEWRTGTGDAVDVHHAEHAEPQQHHEGSAVDFAPYSHLKFRTSAWEKTSGPVPAAERMESVRHMLDHYRPYDFDTWAEARDNIVWDHPRVRDFVADVARNGVKRPIPVDYEQDPPQVRNGHTRLLAAERAGIEQVPTRQHEGFMDPDDPDHLGRGPDDPDHWTNQDHWNEHEGAIRQAGNPGEYRIDMQPDESGDPLHDMGSGDWPKDFYDRIHEYDFSHGEHGSAHLTQIRRARGDPEKRVRIYRAAPAQNPESRNAKKGEINHGDWVTLNKPYAEEDARGVNEVSADKWKGPNHPQRSHIWSTVVPAKHIRSAGNDLMEWGYFGPDRKDLEHNSERCSHRNPFIKRERQAPRRRFEDTDYSGKHHFGGQRGDLPELEYYHVLQGREQGGYHAVAAAHEGQVIGHLTWGPGRTKINQLWVHPDYRRHGVAEAIHQRAQWVEPGLQHHTDRTEAGDAWARSVSGDVPEHLDDTTSGDVERKGAWAASQFQQRLDQGHRTMKRLAVLPVPGLRNPHTGGDEWFHGTMASPEELKPHGFADPSSVSSLADMMPESETEGGHWNSLLGTHFTADHDVAKAFAEGEHSSGANERTGDWEDGEYGEPHQGIVHARLGLANPKVYASEHDMDHEAYEHEHAAGNHPSNHVPGIGRKEGEGDEDEQYEAEEMWHHAHRIAKDYGHGEIPASTYGHMRTPFQGHPMRTAWLNTHPDKYDIAMRFKKRLQAAGHDGVVYGNEYERSRRGREANKSAIAFDPDQIHVTQHHESDSRCLDPDEAQRHQSARRRPLQPGQEECWKCGVRADKSEFTRGSVYAPVAGRPMECTDKAACSQRRAEGRRTAANYRGKFRCKDCGWDTNSAEPGVRTENYVVHNDVWHQAGMDKMGGNLCVGCLEKRLGRQLHSGDFPAVPVNDLSDADTDHAYTWRTDRLKDRIQRQAGLLAHFAATDWAQLHDKIPGEIHRGLYAPESHGVFSAPMSDEDVAHGLIAAHQEEQFPHQRDQRELFGTHWSSDEGVARDFAQEHERAHFEEDDQCPGHDEHSEATPVVFHARRPQRHEIEDDPRRLGWQNVDDYDTHEKEVPIRHGAPVHITGVSWLKHTGLGPLWHRHELREPVKLRAEDRDSPSDPNQWNASLHTAAWQPTERMTDIWHSTSPWKAGLIREQGFNVPAVHASDTPDSEFMKIFGDARVHLRLPADVVAAHPDPDEPQDRAQGWAPMDPGEKHYAIPARLVRPEHIVGVTGTSWHSCPDCEPGSNWRDTPHGQHTAAWVPKDRIFGPTYGLDRRLFTPDEELKPEVRQALLGRLQTVLEPVLGQNWDTVTRVCLAGSEASRWTSPELVGNGDLDVLIGVAYSYARQEAPHLAGLTDLGIDKHLNAALQQDFNAPGWHPPFGPDDTYDLTGYVNHNALDIRAINPYAAYDLTNGEWAVKPPDLPDWSAEQFPQGPAIMQEARALIAQVRAVLRLPEPFRTQEASRIWDSLHQARGEAFAPGGLGWQGTGNILEKAIDQASGKLVEKLKALKYGPADHTSANHAPMALGHGMTTADLGSAHA